MTNSKNSNIQEVNHINDLNLIIEQEVLDRLSNALAEVNRIMELRKTVCKYGESE